MQREKKEKMRGTNKMENLIFPLKSTQDYNTESKRSPSSLPHLIIENENRFLDTLTLI
jgi:hypothetical protein